MPLDNDQTTIPSQPFDTDDAENGAEYDWLLEQDMSDPVERLFSVHEEGTPNIELSDAEAEMAGRPMFRGHGKGDDISSLFAEDIVAVDVGSGADIYGSSEVQSDDMPELDESLWVDYGNRSITSTGEGLQEIADGTDIFALSDSDDIGETFLTLVNAKNKSSLGSKIKHSSHRNNNTQPDIPEADFVNHEDDLGLDFDGAITLDLSIDFNREVAFESGNGKEKEDENFATDIFAESSEEPQEFLSEIDLASDFTFGGDLDLSNTNNSLIDLAPDLELPVDPELEINLEAPFEIGAALDIQALHEAVLDAEMPSEEIHADREPMSESIQTDLSALSDDSLDKGEYCANTAPETVLEYVANTPAPLDDDAFDEYLLRGDQLEDNHSDQESLTVETTKGLTSVDPALEQAIDYHEDFEMMAGFKDDTASVITGVISQVMQELTSSLVKRLSDYDVDSETIVIDVLLGNDVNSIIQCVTDGYLPIVDIQPQIPAALRQLGQSEVDAIYVRFSHPEIKADWNSLFNDDFSLPGTDDTEQMLVEIDEPQPFAAFDLDEFDFDSEVSHSHADTFNLDFDENLSAITEFSSDDPLSSIEFAAVAESQVGSDESVELMPSAEPELEVEVAQTQLKETRLPWCVPSDIHFNTSSGAGEIYTDFLNAFIEEATTELEKLEDAIGAWEGQVSLQPAAVPKTIAHTLHTVKGIAKGVGLQCYGTLIHNYETLLDALTMPADNDASGYFKIINAWLDAVIQGFEHIELTRTDVHSELPVETSVSAPILEEPALEQVNECLSYSAVPNTKEAHSFAALATIEELSRSKAGLLDAPAAKYIPEQQTEQQLADEGAKALAGQQSIRMSAEAMDDLLNLTNQAQQLGVRSAQSTVRSKLAATELLGRLPSVRAHIARIADRALSRVSAKGETSGSALDALEMDQYSELQEAANILRESVEDLDDLVKLSSRQASTAEALLKQQAAVIASLGSSIQAARVIPVSRMIPGLRRIVRTVGADLGKSVAFKVLNQVGTLDRDNHARCQVILEHMVRNAMDHGIESAQDRLELGKPASGTITIDVKKQGADYIISLSDDGRGVDPTIMRETAYRKGLDMDVDALTDDEAIKLIFHTGFSTAAQVSEISGRGVGMDIVLTELKQIGGDIEIETVVGEGTQFHIRIPPNVSVNGALLVAVGDRSYAIPLDGLIAVDNVDVDVFFNAVAEKRSLSLYGMECEPAYLATLCQGNSLPEQATWNNTVPVMIAGSEDRYMAIAVDDVKQALELVIRSLGVQFSNVAGVAGATTTVDGQAVVALDLNALVGSVEIGQYSNVPVTPEPEENLLVLVVDDSRTQRMVSTSQFDTLGVETITAENGMVAIDFLNTTQTLPDVILLDVEMPVKDGIQTLREIRKSVRYSHIPVIMVTSRTGAKHRALADEAGCNGYMGKPFNFPVLVEKISELTGYNLQLN
jgi:chemotaxis protein histidine kinase CheA/CheY-like chemotaxis protein